MLTIKTDTIIFTIKCSYDAKKNKLIYVNCLTMKFANRKKNKLK